MRPKRSTAAGRCAGGGEVRLCGGVVAVERDRALEGGERIARAAGGGVRDAEVVVHLGALGREPRGELQLGERPYDVPALERGAAEPEVPVALERGAPREQESERENGPAQHAASFGDVRRNVKRARRART